MTLPTEDPKAAPAGTAHKSPEWRVALKLSPQVAQEATVWEDGTLMFVVNSAGAATLTTLARAATDSLKWAARGEEHHDA